MNAVVGVVVIVIIYVVFKWYTRKKPCKLPPGPKGFPLFGHIGLLSHKSVWNHRKLYGDISYMNVFGKDIVCLNSIDAIREAMHSRNGAFDHRPVTFTQRYLAYKDIVFNSPTEYYWKKMRHFMQTSLKTYGKRKMDVEDVVAKELAVVCEILGTTEQESVDLHDVLQPSLANSICILLVNERYPYDHEMIEWVKNAVDSVNYLGNPFVDMVLLRFPFVRYLPFEYGNQYRKHIKSKEKIMQRIFERNKNLSISELQERKGIVYNILTEAKTSDWADDESVLLGAIDDVLEAGIITTKCALYAFFSIIVNHPDVQTKIQSEIDEIVGRDRRACVSDKANMPYTQATLLETLRYTSIVPIPMPHTCREDTDLRGFTIPKGSTIISNLFLVHHDPELWRDPWCFDPSRFLDSTGQFLPASHPSRKNVIPFGIGTRACLGQTFAKTRMFLYATHILQRFSLLPVSNTFSCDPRDYIADMIIHPFPYRVKMQRR